MMNRIIVRIPEDKDYTISCLKWGLKMETVLFWRVNVEKKAGIEKGRYGC